jgi:hypothetical protein
MRRSALAVAVVTVFTMVLALAGSAGAAVTGSVWDPEDVPPEVLPTAPSSSIRISSAWRSPMTPRLAR